LEPDVKTKPAEEPRHHLDKRAESLLAIGIANGDDDDLLETKSVAKWIGTTPQWLSIGRTKKYGPKFIKVSKRRVAYRRGDVRAWLKSRTFASTKEYAARGLKG
jgi:predicted DNA-binding transcriptional regulator AlpA